MAKAEQLGRLPDGRGFRRWRKRQTSKIWRRAARRDPEGAPTRRPTKGWAD